MFGVHRQNRCTVLLCQFINQFSRYDQRFLIRQCNGFLCPNRIHGRFQSIYKFRGANIGNILGYEKVFPQAKVIKLEQNYRSTQNILNAANEVIKNNEGRKDKTLWTANEEGAPIHFRQFQNGYEEAEYIAGAISQKVREGIYDYKDCAILYRTNAQSDRKSVV